MIYSPNRTMVFTTLEKPQVTLDGNVYDRSFANALNSSYKSLGTGGGSVI